MFDSIIWFVFVVLILLGTVAICYLIMLKLLLSKMYNAYYVILPCNENSKDVRKKAYGMRIKLNFIRVCELCLDLWESWGLENEFADAGDNGFQ